MNKRIRKKHKRWGSVRAKSKSILCPTGLRISHKRAAELYDDLLSLFCGRVAAPDPRE